MDELTDLIDLPNERLEAEYKDWLDLSEELSRAKVARHIAALANFGGGYLVFGFADKTMMPTGANPWPQSYSHDGIGSLIKKYLEPAFEVNVRHLRSNGGNDHTIVVVPPHGAVPICCKQNGPGDAKGQPQGINRGIYYTRKPLPESAPIVTEAEWLPIIRRCAMHDRTALLGALTAVLSGPHRADAPGGVEQLQSWHTALRRKFLAKPLIQSSDILLNNAQFSYSIASADGQRLDPAEMVEILTQVNKEAVDRVNTGWSMLFPFTRQPIAPYLTSDPEAGTGDEEFLEADLTLDGGKPEADSDMWRVSQTGLVSLIRPIRLDFLQHRGWSPKYFSLNEAARNVGQLVRHAQGLSERFNAPTEVAFLCEWSGLYGRELADPNGVWSSGRVARTNSRKTNLQRPIGELSSNWPTVVAELIAPLVRSFDPSLRLGSDWIAQQAAHWRPIGGQWP